MSVLARARPLDGSAAPVATPRSGPAAPRAMAAAEATPRLGGWERAFLIGALLDQQDAFLNILAVVRGMDAQDAPEVNAASDPANVALVAATLVGLAILIPRRRAPFLKTMQDNAVVLALCGFIFLSTLWSISPGLTAKRAVVHLNSILLPLYIATRLRFAEAWRLVAQAMAVAAVGSLVAAVGFPRIGVMQTAGLEGKWRGVFTHKNALGQSMGLGVMLQAYLVATRRGWGRAAAAAVFFLEIVLIVRSNSITVLGIAAVSLGVFAAAWISRRGARTRAALMLAAAAVLAASLALLVLAPDLLTRASGRDASLSGRTGLWAGVMDAIRLRPWLGYGFQAFWQGFNPLAADIWRAIRWNAPNAHNGLLEVALGLGVAGVAFAVAVLAQAWVRAARLVARPGLLLEGAAALILVCGLFVESLTEAVLVQQGDVDWVVLNLISFMAMRAWRDSAPAPPRLLPIVERARPV